MAGAPGAPDPATAPAAAGNGTALAQNMRITRMLTATTMALALGLGLATVATAQEASAPEMTSVEITAELLERFVAVYPTVIEIAQAAQAEMRATESADAARSIQDGAQRRILAVLQEGDLTAMEYDAVVQRLNEDEELRAEFQRLLEAAMAEGGVDR
jgi:hypothetical protein